MRYDHHTRVIGREDVDWTMARMRSVIDIGLGARSAAAVMGALAGVPRVGQQAEQS